MGAAIFYPAFVHVGLIVMLLLWLGWERRKALLRGETSYARTALDNTQWPDRARKLANCYQNQFELPVVFYMLCLVAHGTGQADMLMVVLAWLFVASRLGHAYVHVTSNYVPLRGLVFGFGLLAVIAMTGILALRLLVTAA